VTEERENLPAWRHTLGVAGLLVGLLLVVVAVLAADLPVNRYVPPAFYVFLGTDLALGLVLIGLWAWGQRRPALTGRRSWKVINVVLGLALLVSAGLGVRIDDWSRMRWVSDLGTVYTACGPFGIFSHHFEHEALAQVRRAFPGYRVGVSRGCREADGPGGAYQVEIAVGPFTEKGLPTSLVVEERVFPGPLGADALMPYGNVAEVKRDLRTLDAAPAVRHAMGQQPRLCIVEVGDGGFGPDAFMTCLRQGHAPAASPGPTPWPPPVPRSCDSPVCLEVDLALPRERTPKVHDPADDHRHLTTFAHTSSTGGP